MGARERPVSRATSTASHSIATTRSADQNLCPSRWHPCWIKSERSSSRTQRSGPGSTPVSSPLSKVIPSLESSRRSMKLYQQVFAASAWSPSSCGSSVNPPSWSAFPHSPWGCCVPILNVQLGGEARSTDGRKIPIPPQAALTLRGPIVQVTVSVGQAIAQQLLQQGGTLPPPVSGLALIDTGATSTCVDDGAAHRRLRRGLHDNQSKVHAVVLPGLSRFVTRCVTNRAGRESGTQRVPSWRFVTQRMMKSRHLRSASLQRSCGAFLDAMPAAVGRRGPPSP